jgi:ABC-type transporter Mla MlaB component
MARGRFAGCDAAPRDTNDFGLAFALLSSVGARMPMTYRISRAAQPDGIVFTLSGVLDSEHATRLEDLLALEVTPRVVLDLTDITLVDSAAVRFLALVEAAGAEIVNCPGYVRRWINAEQDYR